MPSPDLPPQMWHRLEGGYRATTADLGRPPTAAELAQRTGLGRGLARRFVAAKAGAGQHLARRGVRHHHPNGANHE